MGGERHRRELHAFGLLVHYRKVHQVVIELVDQLLAVTDRKGDLHAAMACAEIGEEGG
jgi:hypothetical protein